MYEGYWSEGKRNGFGKYIWNNGKAFYGKWVNDKVEE